MPTFMKSDLVWKFVGGFVLGTIGVLTLSPASARMKAPDAPSAPVSAKMIDATR